MLLLSFIVGFFTYFHLGLAATNQTTNEIFKRWNVGFPEECAKSQQAKAVEKRKATLRKRTEPSSSKEKPKAQNSDPPKQTIINRTPYFKGIFANFYEVITS